MKKSSMNMAPNGRIPAIRILLKRKHASTQKFKYCTGAIGHPSDCLKHSPYKLVHVPALLWNLPRDLVGAHWVIIWLFAEAKIVAQVHQGHGDTEPHTQQGQHCGEGDLRWWRKRAGTQKELSRHRRSLTLHVELMMWKYNMKLNTHLLHMLRICPAELTDTLS